MSSILVVDDDQTFRERLGKAFLRRGFAVYLARDFQSGLAEAQKNQPRFAVLDLRMPGPSGLDLVEEIRKVSPKTNLLILTGYGSIATAVQAMRLGAVDYLNKPADADEILQAFERVEKKGPADLLTSHLYGSKGRRDLFSSLARVEWEHINRALTDCEGNISQAARVLGIHRRSLQRKLAKFPVKQ